MNRCDFPVPRDSFLQLSYRWSVGWMVLWCWMFTQTWSVQAAEPSGWNGTFTFATYNIFNRNTNLTQLDSLILSMKADVVALQETTSDSEKRLRSELASVYPHQHYQAAPGSGGFGFLSRWPIQKIRYLPPLDGPRGTLLGEVVLPDGRSLHFATVHLITPNSSGVDSITGALSMFERAGEVQDKEIRRIEKELGSGRPAVIAGDFNSFSFGTAQTYLKGLGWIDSLASVDREADHKPTWRGRKRGLSAPFRIDFIFHSPDLATLESRVLSEGASDHYPVVSLLRISPSGSTP